MGTSIDTAGTVEPPVRVFPSLSYSIPLLLFAFSFAIAMYFNPGTSDVGLFIKVMNNVWSKGLVNGYATNAQFFMPVYPPLSSAGFLLAKWLSVEFGLGDLAGYKFLILLALFASTALLVTRSSNILVGASFVVALAICSTGLGYFDIWYCPFLFLALKLIEKDHPELGFSSYFVACMIKWQPIIVAPFFVIYAFKIHGARGVVKALTNKRLWTSAAVVVALSIGALSIFDGSIFESLHAASAHSHLWLTGNAFNVPWIAGSSYDLFHAGISHGLSSNLAGLGVHQWAYYTFRFLFLLLYLWLVIGAVSEVGSDSQALFVMTLGAWTYFMVSTGVHENHSATAVFLAFYLTSRDWKFWPVAALTGAHLNINLTVLYWINTPPPLRAYLSLLAAILGVASYFLLVFMFSRSLCASIKSQVSASNWTFQPHR